MRSNADVMHVKKILLDQNVKTVENISTIRNNSHSHNEECYECEDCTVIFSIKINIVIQIDEECAKYFLNQDQHCHSH